MIILKIQEIKKILENNSDKAFLELLASDERAGVKKLLDTYYKRIEKEKAEQQRFTEMMQYEKSLYASGYQFIAGVDEAGRGPLAGPLVVAAVILPENIFIKGLNDSKQLSAKKRDALYDEILSKAQAVSVNIVSISNIDKLNIYHATQQAMQEVLLSLDIRPEAALIDAMPVEAENIKIQSVIHGDALSISIAAASIIAKVTRDRIMDKLDLLYPEYKFASNKGYGSKEHMQAVKEKGATRWHRRSYEPVKSMHLPDVAHEDNIIYSPLLTQYEYEPKR